MPCELERRRQTDCQPDEMKTELVSFCYIKETMTDSQVLIC